MVVTSTPTPENVVTATAVAARATEVARTVGTYTPAPAQWVTPIVTPRPTPGNAARGFPSSGGNSRDLPIRHADQDATQCVDDHADTNGNDESGRDGGGNATGYRVPTSTPTPVYVIIQGQLPPLPPTRTPTPVALPMPKALIGRIAFLSDRAALADNPNAPALSNPQVYVINPEGTGLALLTDRWPYDQAVKHDRFSADQNYLRAFVRDIPQEHGKQPAVFYYDYMFNAERQVTMFGSGIAYDPAWSPTADRIALVSNDSSNDEIWVVDRDGRNGRQLTETALAGGTNTPPPGRSMANNTYYDQTGPGKRQIWIMDADGRNPHTLSMTGYNDWDPVSIKLEDPPRHDFEE